VDTEDKCGSLSCTETLALSCNPCRSPASAHVLNLLFR
jgi:hypothetical protein